MDSKSDQTYCRLCAITMDSEKGVNFETNSPLKEKLERFNKTLINVEEKLPKTVCIPCVASLDSAVHFIQRAQESQVTLRNIFFKMKEESTPEVLNYEINVNEVLKYESEAGYAECGVADLNTQEVEEPVMYDVQIQAAKESSAESSSTSDSESEILDTDEIESESASSTSDSEKTLKPTKKKRDNKRDKTTWEQYSWFCWVCEKYFPTFAQLTAHSKEEHSNCSTYKCTECRRRSVRLHLFIAHVKSHRKNLQWSCHFCFRYYQNRSALKNHIKSHIYTKHCCPGCNMCFKDAVDLDLHMKTFYKDSALLLRKRRKEERLYCEECNKEFKTYRIFSVHLQKNHKMPRYACEHCGESFAYNHQLKRHVQKKHTEGSQLQCMICNRIVCDLTQLRRHVKIHDTSQQFPCDKCGKVFRMKRLLISHEKNLHSNVELHICQICGKGFKCETYLKRHQRIHSNEKPYECSICPWKFTSWPNYRKHMLRKHNINVAKYKITPAGAFPIDPATGEIQAIPQTVETEEWKKSILARPEKKQSEPEPSSSNAVTAKIEEVNV